MKPLNRASTGFRWKTVDSCGSPAFPMWRALTSRRLCCTRFAAHLHMQMLSLEGGQISIDGVVDALAYEDDGRESGGLFSRLFR